MPASHTASASRYVLQVSNIGPCGQKDYAQKTNWNKEEHGWGLTTVATYNTGNVVDVEWCVSDEADHGGLYSYRLPAQPMKRRTTLF